MSFGEVTASNIAQGRFLAGQGGGEGGWRGAREGRGGKGSRRPALMFLAQAVLSFVGMVVIPTRLALEVLVVQPPAGAAAAGAAAVSLDLRSDAASARTPAAAAAAATGAASGLEGRGERRRLSDSYGSGLWGDGGEGEGWRAAGSKGRVLQTADDEESFSYTTRTQFHLCAEPGSSLTEESLRAGVMDVFGVEEAQVCVCVCV